MVYHCPCRGLSGLSGCRLSVAWNMEMMIPPAVGVGRQKGVGRPSFDPVTLSPHRAKKAQRMLCLKRSANESSATLNFVLQMTDMCQTSLHWMSLRPPSSGSERDGDGTVTPCSTAPSPIRSHDRWNSSNESETLSSLPPPCASALVTVHARQSYDAIKASPSTPQLPMVWDGVCLYRSCTDSLDGVVGHGKPRRRRHTVVVAD